jgi:putative endonuclease
MNYFLYILKSKSILKYYTGISLNPERRLEFHNTIEKGFTSRYRPWKIVFKQEFESRQLAQLAERKIKKWKSIEMIEKIVSGEIEL